MFMLFLNSKKLIQALLITVTASAAISCDKLIEIPPNAPGQIVTAQVFADSANATAAVVQLYSPFSSPVLGLQAGGLTVLPALSADELVTNVSDQFLTTAYTNSFVRADPTLPGYWSSFYGVTGVYQANACITGVETSTGISESAKNQLIGEAEFMRAFTYFHMVNWFGGVPIVLTNDYKASASLPRSRADDVYKLIIADLEDAEQRLKPGYPSARKARPNRYAATALLARAYLYTGNWKKAAEKAGVVINAGYSLETDLNRVFLRGSKEAIWSVETVYSWIMTTEGQVFNPYASDVIPDYYLAPSLLAAFEPADRRFSDWTNTNNVSGTSGTTKYTYPFKYKKGTDEEDYVILRLAEQYLIRAEAASKSGDQAGAIDDLNVIRRRAGLANYNGSLLPDAVQKAIWHERQIEMFCELGTRWYDLKRNGTVNDVMAASKPTTWPADGRAALYPIPQSEIQRNSKLEQNPGY